MSTAPLSFLKAYFTHPRRTGAVAPSSPRLARMMVRGFDLENADVVVELGPGTGALTTTILERIGEQTRFLAIERNGAFVEHLRGRFPDLDIVHGSAEETPQHLAAANLPKASYIVSGLPWAAFPEDLQRRLLGAVVESLGPGDKFTTFAYTGMARMKKGRRFRRQLEEHFGKVELTPVVWRNLPPAFAYQATL